MTYSVLMSLYIKEQNDFFISSVESMLEQTVCPEQIVIVLDGPITQELELSVAYYESKYNELFTIVRLKNNLGLGLALNEGLKMCRNSLVARMDTDDISLKNRCELQLKEFKINPDLCIVGSWTFEFQEDPKKPTSIRKVPVSHEDILNFSKTRSPFNHPTVMYKRNDILSIGGYNDILRNEDYDLFYRLLKNGYISKNINQPLILFRSNDDNLNRRKSWQNCKGYIDVSKKMYKDNYISFFDYTYVFLSQLFFYFMPSKVVNYISRKFLRTSL